MQKGCHEFSESNVLLWRVTASPHQPSQNKYNQTVSGKITESSFDFDCSRLAISRDASVCAKSHMKWNGNNLKQGSAGFWFRAFSRLEPGKDTSSGEAKSNWTFCQDFVQMKILLPHSELPDRGKTRRWFIFVTIFHLQLGGAAHAVHGDQLLRGNGHSLLR